MKKLFFAVFSLFFIIVNVHAQTPYYQGKTIRIVTGYPAGRRRPSLAAAHRSAHDKICPATLASSSRICRGQAP